MKESLARAEPGLSRSEVRRRAFLDAAAEVLFEQGFEAASVNEVVRRAGGSLATLYAQFGNKEGLFLAALEDRVRAVAETIDVAAVADLPVAAGLQVIGERYLEALLRPNGVALFRILVAEARKSPELTRSFMAAGPTPVRAAVAAYLAERNAAEETAVADPLRAAGAFLDMVGASPRMQALFEPEFVMDDGGRAAHVKAAVTLFLSGALRR
jgi:AcrR family transcriptional regulator